jgi:hypothetical protein
VADWETDRRFIGHPSSLFEMTNHNAQFILCHAGLPKAHLYLEAQAIPDPQPAISPQPAS